MAKVIVMIQAHMLSKRLPGKVMLDLNGETVLYHVYKRCSLAKTVDKTIILTSTNPENDVIQEFCEKLNIPFFRGSENDVLDRYYECAKELNPDIIVRVTSDCPLIEPKIIDFWIDNVIKDQIEFIKEEEGLYEGLGIDIFTMGALVKMKKRAIEDKQKEHVVGYFYDNPKEFTYKKYVLPKELKFAYSKHRLTLDTQADYELIRNIYSMFYMKKEIVNLKEVIEYLNTNQKEANLNQHIVKKDYFSEE